MDPERRAARARARANSEWVREVLERAEAALPREQRRPEGLSNGEWLRLLAERGKAELEARKSRDA